ncbi:MAG: AAA family ATPase, partial [Planctomycetaceae bacterium]
MLKSLELFGFKSFAERTRFDFAAGITGVVGPNGSGKSNVVDAVKWILGDQSAKSLRGEEMTDVIFNGAAGRAPSQFAEAVLTFDNSSGFLPVEAAEVQIGRRLWRGGDSEYLINRRTARRKDLIDLLRGTGAGSAAYSIIEQGRVDQILQASATTRRNVFEEAAGISRFKARRIEAERKLERVAQHVERLTDLVDQLEAQLTATRSQAAKAAAFRELSNELKELWLGLAADDHRRLSARLEEVERSRTECGEQIEQHSGRLSELEAALAEQDERLADADQRLRGTERRRGEARETIVRHEATIRHQSARVTELEAEQARLRRQRSIMAVRLREVLAEREHNCGVLEVSRREIAAGQDDMLRRDHRRDDLQEHIAVQRQSIERDRQAHLKRVREFSTTENRIESIESQ